MLMIHTNNLYNNFSPAYLHLTAHSFFKNATSSRVLVKWRILEDAVFPVHATL